MSNRGRGRGTWGGPRGGRTPNQYTYTTKNETFTKITQNQNAPIQPRYTPTPTLNTTLKSKNNLIIYCIYVRNHGPTGTFKDVLTDLPRIKGMGVDILWFMPVHPIGQHQKKGPMGCPYAIRDFRGINSEYGNLEDFCHVIEKIHNFGLRVMLDVVFNHSSPDCDWVYEHPEWYFHDKNGKITSSNQNWSDTVEFDFSDENSGLWEELIDILCFWVKHGVDGFRCDVATLIPLQFWKKAKKQVNSMFPHILWLAETFIPKTCENRKKKKKVTHTVPEMYQVFDITYDYDYFPVFRKVLKGEVDGKLYLEMFRYQDTIYPVGYNKLRFVENHDTTRIVTAAKNDTMATAWTAFSVFNHGPFLIYSGLESKVSNTPSKFGIDKIIWGDYGFQPFLTQLFQLKKKISVDGDFTILGAHPVISAIYYNFKTGNGFFGVFNVNNNQEEFMKCCIEDGIYVSEIYENTTILVKNGSMRIPKCVEIVSFVGQMGLKIEPIQSFLF